jgi:hypothetical protein
MLEHRNRLSGHCEAKKPGVRQAFPDADLRLKPADAHRAGGCYARQPHACREMKRTRKFAKAIVGSNFAQI